MRAAADYMMGRYRDAHNDLAGAVLRFRPPCRLVARADRSRAWRTGRTPMPIWNRPAPVLNRYPAGMAGARPSWPMRKPRWAWAGWIWPTRRLPRLPTTLDATPGAGSRTGPGPACWPPKAVIAEPRAQFAAVENGGDEKLAAQAIFYQTSAALNAGAITPQQAIEIAGEAALPLARRSRWR